MANREYDFGEKTKEYSAKHKDDIPVWKTPKYEAAKKKAMEIIDSGLYGVGPEDFWILKNTTKTDKMAYTGLIISHNGCLKINDRLEDRFRADCVRNTTDGYGDSLVYTYCCPEQGLYEVGEVSKKNCTNDYPYAMALKRLFDRVVLKLSKLAYSGIMSDSESEEFSQNLDGPGGDTGGGNGGDKRNALFCEECGAEIDDYISPSGKKTSAWDMAVNSVNLYKKQLCAACCLDAERAKKANDHH